MLGYTELVVNPTAYTSGLQFDESIAMCGRMTELAKSRGLSFGAKFSNTLEVLNHRDFFAEERKGDVPVGPAAACDHAHADRRVPPGGGAGGADFVLGRRRPQEHGQHRGLRHRAGHDLHRPA